jgi:hypothetical protein
MPENIGKNTNFFGRLVTTRQSQADANSRAAIAPTVELGKSGDVIPPQVTSRTVSSVRNARYKVRSTVFKCEGRRTRPSLPPRILASIWNAPFPLTSRLAPLLMVALSTSTWF